MTWAGIPPRGRRPLVRRPTERYVRVRVTCPNCGRAGVLVVGAGLHPFVEHRAEPEINTGASPCWLPPEHPAVAWARSAAA